MVRKRPFHNTPGREAERDLPVLYRALLFRSLQAVPGRPEVRRPRGTHRSTTIINTRVANVGGNWGY